MCWKAERKQHLKLPGKGQNLWGKEYRCIREITTKVTENKGTAPKKMAPENSHGEKSSTDREIIQHSSQQKSKTKGGKRGKQQQESWGCLQGMTRQAMNRGRLTDSSFVPGWSHSSEASSCSGSRRCQLRGQVLLISSVGKADFNQSGQHLLAFHVLPPTRTVSNTSSSAWLAQLKFAICLTSCPNYPFPLQSGIFLGMRKKNANIFYSSSNRCGL